MYIKICSYCGKQYATQKKKQKYCSPACQYASLRVDRGTAVCKQCGKTFVVGRECKGLFCSNTCSGKYKYLNNPKIKSCLELGRQSNEELKQIKLIADNLSKELKRLKKRYAKLQNELKYVKRCEVCNKQFIAKNINQKYCCKKCVNKHDWQRKINVFTGTGNPTCQ